MLLDVTGLTKTFGMYRPRKRRTSAVAGVDFVAGSGECIGIVGESGAGKTTLGLMLAGLLKPDSGSIRIQGRDLWALPPKERRKGFLRVQMIFQHPETTFNPRWTLGRSFREPFGLQDLPYSREVEAVHLERVGLDGGILARYPAQASGGELQRLALARALVLDPAVLVLDEATSMLDAITQARIIRLLQDLQRRSGIGYILVSHDRELVRRVCDRVLEMQQGALKPVHASQGRTEDSGAPGKEGDFVDKRG